MCQTPNQVFSHIPSNAHSIIRKWAQLLVGSQRSTQDSPRLNLQHEAATLS